jgi:hypothetical protein
MKDIKQNNLLNQKNQKGIKEKSFFLQILPQLKLDFEVKDISKLSKAECNKLLTQIEQFIDSTCHDAEVSKNPNITIIESVREQILAITHLSKDYADYKLGLDFYQELFFIISQISQNESTILRNRANKALIEYNAQFPEQSIKSLGEIKNLFDNDFKLIASKLQTPLLEQISFSYELIKEDINETYQQFRKEYYLKNSKKEDKKKPPKISDQELPSNIFLPLHSRLKLAIACLNTIKPTMITKKEDTESDINQLKQFNEFNTQFTKDKLNTIVGTQEKLESLVIDLVQSFFKQHKYVTQKQKLISQTRDNLLEVLSHLNPDSAFPVKSNEDFENKLLSIICAGSIIKEGSPILFVNDKFDAILIQLSKLNLFSQNFINKIYRKSDSDLYLKSRYITTGLPDLFERLIANWHDDILTFWQSADGERLYQSLKANYSKLLYFNPDNMQWASSMQNYGARAGGGDKTRLLGPFFAEMMRRKDYMWFINMLNQIYRFSLYKDGIVDPEKLAAGITALVRPNDGLYFKYFSEIFKSNEFIQILQELEESREMQDDKPLRALFEKINQTPLFEELNLKTELGSLMNFLLASYPK